MMMKNKPLALGALLLGMAWAGAAAAADYTVTGPDGKPLPLVMVTRQPATPIKMDDSDSGYPTHGKLQQGTFEHTRFSDAQGRVRLPDQAGDMQIRLRKPGFQDVVIPPADLTKPNAWRMVAVTDPKALAEQRPSNAWTSTLTFGGNTELKKEFMLQCNYCHQQGGALLRRERSADEWKEAMKRMVRYGSRLSSEAREQVPALLEAHWKDIAAHPEKVPEGTPWASTLSRVTVRELPIGDAMSQMHDLLVHRNDKVYVGDNLQDRLWEIDPATGAYTVYRVPPQPGDRLGGLLPGRLADFPRHQTYQGIHSLAESQKDGHIFLTPSHQRRLIEFDPVSKQFTQHEMDSGFYPHTVRVDAKDRVWFTLALSNQVAMFDRTSKQFTTYDLPFRSLMERITIKLTPTLMGLTRFGIPVANLVKVDHQSTGVPLPYGLDITPDGRVWFARLYTNEIGSIDPDTGKLTMIATPFKAPRRLRADAQGNLWIAAFNESLIARYNPAKGEFTQFDLPVVPKGSDTPYSLNVDRGRNQVWVNGTNSDSVYRLDVASGHWDVYPMPRKVTFTRDVEIDRDGRAYVTGAAFPSWHIEGAQPTLMEITP